jgi:Dolichyl-phosphate-mannose-protein mannosyltransferase
MPALIAALVISALLLASRLDLARVVGLADTEALYAAYGLHPQPAYLGQPGLIGWLSTALGAGASAHAIHVFTAVVSTLLPWAGVAAARALGCESRAALRTYFPLALVPELSIGWFAFGPNLPLCFCWLLSLGAAGFAIRHPPARFGTLLSSIVAGVAAGLACLSHVFGWLLALSLLAVVLDKRQALRWRTLSPWAALGLFAILVAPLVRWRLGGGFGPDLDLRPGTPQVVKSLLYPLLFATPLFIYAGVLILRDLGRRRRDTPIDRLLWLSLVLPFLPQLLCAIFLRDEAEWLMPTYLTLSLHAARAPALRPVLAKSCMALGLSVSLLGWCWLRTDLPFALGQMLGGYEPEGDTSNDLYAWGPGRELLESAVRATRERTGQTPVVVGPHWAVCVQADVALGGNAHVGCDSIGLDDYDYWSKPGSWSEAQTILYVTDSRFHEVPPETFYGRLAVAAHGTTVTRFGRSVRRISISEFDREEEAFRAYPSAPGR